MVHDELVRLRVKMVGVAAAAATLCVTVCMAWLFATSSAWNLETYRTTLQDLSNGVYGWMAEVQAMAEDSPGDTSASLGAVDAYVAAPESWCVLTGAEGVDDVIPLFAGDGQALSADDAARLVTRCDARGDEPFEFAGRTWLGTWLPRSGDGMRIADGAVFEAGASSDSSDEGRLYTVLDVTAHVDFCAGMAMRCIAVGVALCLAVAAVMWCLSGRALRPVRAARERERAFLIAASHELKTPLMAVMANCDVLEEVASEREDLAPWLANIRTAADEMASRIADMLARLRGEEDAGHASS